MQKISWWEGYCSENVDQAVHIFTTKLTDILDKIAPIKKFQTKYKIIVLGKVGMGGYFVSETNSAF